MLSLIMMFRGDNLPNSYVAFVLQMWLVLTGPRESFIGCNVYTCFHAHDFSQLRMSWDSYKGIDGNVFSWTTQVSLSPSRFVPRERRPWCLVFVFGL